MYKKVFGNPDAPLVECLGGINCTPWCARFAFNTNEEGQTSYIQSDYPYRPTIEQVKTDVDAYYNDLVSQKILTGFSYDGIEIWLSTENQSNYITAYTVNASSLTVKGGTESDPQYLTLNSHEQIQTFVQAMQAYIQECIAWGWQQKDSFDYEPYNPDAEATPDAE